VLSISISLIAVFIPILLMGGIVGRLFREFAVTLSVAILVSMAISLTGTPMMCSRILQPRKPQNEGRLFRASEKMFAWILRVYEHSLEWVLQHSALTLAALLFTIALNVYLLIVVPKGFFPQEDTGRLNGGIQGEQDISFQAMRSRIATFADIIKSDPAVAHVMAFTGAGSGNTTNTAFVFVSLKSLEQRDASADQVIARLRPKLAQVPGASLYLQASQDLTVGGRRSNAEYQYTIQSDNLADLTRWGPVILQEMRRTSELTDVNSDQQNSGLEVFLVYDRQTAARMGITPQLLDNTLYDAFGQRPVSTMYTQLNQYHVVMEVEPQFWQSPAGLTDIYLRTATGGEVPLSALTHHEATTAPLSVNHQGQFPSVTLSFNLAPGVALSDAVRVIAEIGQKVGIPANIQSSFTGTLEAFQSSLASEWILVIMALAAVYIVLGILYESYIHPITILSTLPSAGVGAVLALMITGTDLSVIALIGIILLIGIVKKNAILMIDFALEAERKEGKSSKDSIFQACLLRLRPILMTTMAAILGALPLAVGRGTGSELRRPLGIAIIGGLIISQMLTLYSTPVVYLYLDRLSHWLQERKESVRVTPQQTPG
jgi:multidrug efflux pump